MDYLVAFAGIYVAFWVAISVAWLTLKGERVGISGPPLYLMYRTTRFNALIGKIAGASRRTWRKVWNIGIIVGVGAMAYISYLLVQNLVDLFQGNQQAVAIQPIVPVPGLFVSLETFPYLVLAISVVLITHELSHGIASMVDRVPLKATGLFFAHILFGGFVEPDEKALDQAKKVTKLRVFAAGSFTNVALGLLCFLLLANFSATISPFYSVTQAGVIIGSTPSNLPAYQSGLRGGDTIVSLNGTKTQSITDMSSFMIHVRPGQFVVVGTPAASFLVRTVADSTNMTHAIIGVNNLSNNILYTPRLPLLSSELPPVLIRAEFWLAAVSLSVGMFNMLPIYPFDGDHFLKTVLEALGASKIKQLQLRIAVGGAAFFVLGMNVALSLLRFGLLKY